MSTSIDLGELRRSRRRTTLIRWGVAAATVCVLAGLAAIAWFSPLLAVDSVTVDGGEIVDADAVRADVETRTVGVPLPQVRTHRLARDLQEEHTAAASIDVSYAGPRSLRVTVVDRQPVIAVVSGAEAVRYDAGGVRIDAVPAAGLALPVLTVADGADAAAAARDGAALLTDIDGVLDAEVDELTVEPSGTFVLRVHTDDGPTEIVFGTAEDADRKARVAAVLLGEGHERIDVSVPDVPTVG